MAQMLTQVPKYVASTTLREPPPWENSTLLEGDAAEAVAQLKQEPGPDFLIMGCGGLVQSLMRRDLVDEYVLLIHPLVLGTWWRARYAEPGRYQADVEGLHHRDLSPRGLRRGGSAATLNVRAPRKMPW